MRPASLLLTVLVVASLGAGQNPAPRDKQVKPAELCVLEGVAVNANSGEPVRKVWITLSPAGGRAQQHVGQSDSAGRFTFADIEPGAYHLVAAAVNGYPNQVYGSVRPSGWGTPLTLSPGAHLKDIVFRLRPGGVITGTVYDEDGDPVVGARVQALRLAPGRHSRAMSGGSGMTDDRGQYRVYNLYPGQYYVAASEQRWNGTPQSDDLYVPTFYPNSPDPAQAVSVQVRAGDEVSGINLNLVRVRGVRVTGRVIKPVPAKSVQGMYVQLMPRDDNLGGGVFQSYGASSRDETGAFEIHPVPPGSYSLFCAWNDSGMSYFGAFPLDVGNVDIDGITLSLGPAIVLRGRVKIDSGAQLDFTRLTLSLQPARNTPMGGAFAQVKPDGTFVVENVYDLSYRLLVGGFPEEYYVKSAQLGGSDVLTSGLSIKRPDSPGTLEVELSLDGGRIDGTVLHEMKPVPGAFVVLVPDVPFRNRDDMYSEKTTDELGRFSMLGLPPGDFKLFVWGADAEVDFRDPEFIKLYESRGTRVHIAEKQQQTVHLELILAEEARQ